MTTTRLFKSIACAAVLATAWSALQPARTTAQSVRAVPFNRFYLTSPADAQVHFYTTDQKAPMSWKFEGVEGYVSPQPREYTVPLYRYYFDPWFDHFYAAGASETPVGGGHSWAAEGVTGHVVPKDRAIPGTVPLYRFTRRHRANESDRMFQDHFYSLNSQTPADYIAEGVCCRVFKDAVELPDALVKIVDPAPAARWVTGNPQTIRWAVWTGGGYIRLSYSTNAGQTWTRITDQPAPQNEGVMANATYLWKVPPTLKGRVRLRADWVASPGTTPVPWASAQADVEIAAGTVPAIHLQKK
jgi:hypothetical protein